MEKSEIQIFLAHASEDKEAVSELYDRLKIAGYKPWLDKKDLIPGQNWRQEIPKAIKNSQLFIACLSHQSFAKMGYVQKEFKLALNRYAEMPEGKIYIIPLRLDQCEIPNLEREDYGLSLRDLHWLDYWEVDGFDQLERAITYHQLQLTNKEISQIEQPIVDQKKVEYRQTKKEERIGQQQEIKRLRRQQEEERLLFPQEIQINRQPQKPIRTQPIREPRSRRQFLKWTAGLGAALVTVVGTRKISFNERQLNSSKPELDSFNFKTVTVDQRGERVKHGSDKQAEFFKEDLGNGVNLEMVCIPGGKFLMGTEDEEIKRLVKKYGLEEFRREKPQREVTVQPFFMGKFQVSQAQWREIASLPKVNRDLETDPSRFKGNNRPVEFILWNDAEEFCQRLSKKTGKEYRLPSEAEWEYACRANPAETPFLTTPFHFGETITTNLANYDGQYIYAAEPRGEYRKETIPVGQFSPNAFGLYAIL